MDENNSNNQPTESKKKTAARIGITAAVAGPVGVAAVEGARAYQGYKKKNQVRIIDSPTISKSERKEFEEIQKGALKQAKKGFKEAVKKYNEQLQKGQKAKKPDAYEILAKEYCKQIVEFTNKKPDAARILARENPLITNYLVLKATNPNVLDPTQMLLDSFMGRGFSPQVKGRGRINIGPAANFEQMKVKMRSLSSNVENGGPSVIQTLLIYSNPITALYDIYKKFEPEETRKKREAKIQRFKNNKAFKYLNRWNNKILAKTEKLRAANKLQLARRFAFSRTTRYIFAPIPSAIFDLGRRFLPSPVKGFFGTARSFVNRGVNAVKNFAKKIAKQVLKKAWAVAKKVLAKVASTAFMALRQLSTAFPPLRVALEIARAAWKILKPILGKIFKGIKAGLKALLSGKIHIPSPEELLKKFSLKFAKKFVNPKSKIFWIFWLIPTLIFLPYFFILILVTTILGGGGGGGGDGGGGSTDQIIGGPEEVLDPIPGFTLNLTADPTQMDGPGEITYTITYSYNPAADNPIQLDAITIFNDLPANTKIVAGKTTGNFEVNSTGQKIAWPLSESENQQALTLVLEVTKDNTRIINKAYAETLRPGSGFIDTNSQNLAEIFQGAAEAAGIPLPMIKAIAKKESAVLSYSNEDVVQFNTPNWFSGRTDNAPSLSGNDPLIVKGYAYNTCLYVTCFVGADVRGTMQFEINTWNGIKTALTFSDGHDPDRRYVRDVIFGAGEFLARSAQQYDSRFNFSQNPTDWNETQVRALARTYCGGNPDADVANDGACTPPGGTPYDILVWQYYQEFKAIEGT